MTAATLHSRLGLVAHVGINHACVMLHLGGIVQYTITAVCDVFLRSWSMLVCLLVCVAPCKIEYMYVYQRVRINKVHIKAKLHHK